MRKLLQFALCLMLCPVLAAQQVPANAVYPDAPATSDASDWTRVAELARGDEISVARTGGRSMRCEFAGATKDYLFCDARFRDGEYRFDRAEVERVRRDDGRRNVHIAIGGLAAAGFVWGLADPRLQSKGTPRVLVGLSGGAFGALTGCAISIPVALLVPGRMIYRHPSLPVSAVR